MTNFICTGGHATRLTGIAPEGCKALTMVGGRPIIEWQLDVLGEATIICRPEHQEALLPYGPCVTGRWNSVGPSLAAAMRNETATGPVTVLYADTFLTELPAGTDWVGVSIASGGRNWDVVHPGPVVGEQRVSYDYVEPDRTATVCVGVYSFGNITRLRRTLDFFTGMYAIEGRPWGLGPVLNHYRPPRWEPIPSWQDIGDVDALGRWMTPEVSV